jgi:hypothetical protein
MALEGRLSEFSAAEALLLIAREEKTGRLEIHSSEGRLVVHFERGRVLQARDPDLSPDDSFLQLLKEAHVVGAEQWKSLAARRRERGDPIEGLLVMGVATRDQLKEWLLMHAQGVLDRVLELRDGSFRFVSSPRSSVFAVPLAERTEFMVMEAGRRSDEAKELLATELKRSGVPIMLPGARPVPTDPFRGALLRLINGTRSIGEMLKSSAIPQYELLTLLKTLVEREACAIRSPDGARRRAETRGSTSQAIGRVVATVLAVVFVVGSILIGIKLWSGASLIPH